MPCTQPPITQPQVSSGEAVLEHYGSITETARTPIRLPSRSSPSPCPNRFRLLCPSGLPCPSRPRSLSTPAPVGIRSGGGAEVTGKPGRGAVPRSVCAGVHAGSPHGPAASSRAWTGRVCLDARGVRGATGQPDTAAELHDCVAEFHDREYGIGGAETAPPTEGDAGVAPPASSRRASPCRIGRLSRRPRPREAGLPKSSVARESMPRSTSCLRRRTLPRGAASPSSTATASHGWSIRLSTAANLMPANCPPSSHRRACSAGWAGPVRIKPERPGPCRRA